MMAERFLTPGQYRVLTRCPCETDGDHVSVSELCNQDLGAVSLNELREMLDLAGELVSDTQWLNVLVVGVLRPLCGLGTVALCEYTEMPILRRWAAFWKVKP
jgi:hypothetical protein